MLEGEVDVVAAPAVRDVEEAELQGRQAVFGSCAG